MKNVCLVIRSLANGGAEKQCLMLAKALRDEHDVFLVILDSDPCHEPHVRYIEKEKIPHTVLEGSVWSKIYALRRILRSRKTELLFTYLPSDTVVGAIAGKLAGVSHLIGGIRNSRMELRKIFALRIVHNYLLSCSISNSFAGAKEFAARGFNEKKLLVLPNGFELRWDAIERRPSDTIRIVSVGRFVRQKDFLTAINAFRAVQERLPKSRIELRIIGHGPLEEKLRQWISESSSEDSIQLVINPANMANHYRDADIYLSTSLFEGLSNAVMEAMSFSLPIVATDAGDNRMLVRNGINGYVCRIGAVTELCSALCELASSHELRLRYGRESYEIVRNEYGFDAFRQRYLDVVDRLTMHGAGATPDLEGISNKLPHCLPKSD